MTMNDFYHVIVPSIGLIMLMMTTSIYYWFKGKNAGVAETVSVFMEYEPDAVERINKKLKEKLDVELE